jgi:hypothetical protein
VPLGTVIKRCPPPPAARRHGDHAADFTDIRRPGEGLHGAEELYASAIRRRCSTIGRPGSGQARGVTREIRCSAGKPAKRGVSGLSDAGLAPLDPGDSARLRRKFPSRPNNELNRPCKEANSLKAAETGIDHLISQGAEKRAMAPADGIPPRAVDAHGSSPPGSDPGAWPRALPGGRLRAEGPRVEPGHERMIESSVWVGTPASGEIEYTDAPPRPALSATGHRQSGSVKEHGCANC